MRLLSLPSCNLPFPVAVYQIIVFHFLFCQTQSHTAQPLSEIQTEQEMHCPVQTQERCSESKHIVLTLPLLADITLEEKRAQVYLITVPAKKNFAFIYPPMWLVG